MDARSQQVSSVATTVAGVGRPDLRPEASVTGQGNSRAIEPTLEALMSQYVSGSSEAFDRLYRSLAPKLFGYLLRLTRNRERAEDLLQITFSKIHRARSSYLTGAPLLPWTLAIARRSFYDERRAARARHEDLSFDGELPEPAPEEPKSPSDAEETLERSLNALPEAYREAIQLTKITGLSLIEAADVLGTTPTAVKLRVHRGYVALRKALETSPAGGA